jgi:hypothetical protein
VAIAVMGAVWFIAMRPSSSPAPAKAPGVTGLANATQAAHGAATQSDASVAAAQAAANAVDPSAPATAPVTQGSTSKSPAAPAAPAPEKLAAHDRSRLILADLRAGKVAVVAFSGDVAADDLGVRRALHGINLHGGKVVVRSVKIANVAHYGAITRGVQVQQAPTVLVIGKDRKARTIVGFTDAHEINQLVGDVGGKSLSR